MMGLDEWGQQILAQAEADSTSRERARLARIRSRLLAVGIPSSVAGGLVTTLIFAGAFSVAKTERVWLPALILGGAAALSGLARAVVAANSVAALERELERESATVAAQPLAPT
jgi:hypothetical protein